MDSVIKHAVLQNEDDDIILPFASEICDSVEKTAIASEAHAIDSWFFSVPVRRLCVATEDIDIGDNISPGANGNCRLTTIEELMANASNLAEPMTAEDFEDAESLPDGIYPIESEDLTVISADMVKGLRASDLITGTILTGETSITLTDTKIKTTSLIDIYFQDKVLAPTAVTVATGSITIEIDEQETDIVVGVRCV